ncbi:MAG: L-2-amino-thiazoline-4-carboxylic acid hydrolase [Ruminiclostridium sp.]
MKFNAVIWGIMSLHIKKYLKLLVIDENAELLIKKAKPIYKDLLSKVEGVSDNNPMSGNITTSFIIISVWLAAERRITPEQMSSVLNAAMADWKMMKLMYGMIDMNTEKGLRAIKNKMQKNADWAAAHPEDNATWDFNFDESLHKDGFYYHFTRCPIAAFCKKYGYEEITPVLCKIDFITISKMHAVLHREHTIAQGGDMCDYWIVGDEIRNPK